MAALAAVARGEDRLSPRTPDADHPLDRRRGEVGPVRQHDHRGLDLRSERRQAAAERRTRAVLPLRTADDARVGLDLVRADHDDHLPDGGAPHPFQDLREEESLLRRSEPRRRPGGQDDRRDRGFS